MSNPPSGIASPRRVQRRGPLRQIPRVNGDDYKPPITLARRTPCQRARRILIAADASDASRRAVVYVAEIIGKQPAFHVGLFHLELPPRMLEWGGSDDPGRSKQAFRRNVP